MADRSLETRPLGGTGLTVTAARRRVYAEAKRRLDSAGESPEA